MGGGGLSRVSGSELTDSTRHTGVLCGCETWFLTLWEEHRLRVFENSVLRGLVGPRMEEVAQ
jgi:hypothetical protein